MAGPSDLTDVTFRSVESNRYPEILDLLYANFHTDEPMSKALQIYDGVNRVPAVDEYTLASLEENLSIMAIDSLTNKLLGKKRELAKECRATKGIFSFRRRRY